MKNLGIVLSLCTLMAAPAFANTSADEANTSPSGQNVGPGDTSGSNAGFQGTAGMGSTEEHPGTASDQGTGQMGSTGESGSSDMSSSGTTATKHRKHHRRHSHSSSSSSSGTSEISPNGGTGSTGASGSEGGTSGTSGGAAQ